jgi:hypothetical protein
MQKGTNLFAGHAPYELCKDEAAGDGMISGHGARLVCRPELVDQIEDPIWIVEHVEIRGCGRSGRDARTVREQVTNGDAILAIPTELRNERRDRFIDVKRAALRQ